MMVHDQIEQLAPPDPDENMAMAMVRHDRFRSARGLAKHHYGLSSIKAADRKVTRSHGDQTLEHDRRVSSTQTRCLFHISHTSRPNCDSSSDLRTKGFESSTVLATHPRPSDPVPHVAREAFARDSHCSREPQKPLCGHPPPSSQFSYQDERNENTNMGMMSPSSSSLSTPRSRSIKIARTKRSEPDFEADTYDRNKSLYESATWNMYNRIIEHRRQHPINYDDLGTGGAGNSVYSKSPTFLPRIESRKESSSALYGPRALNRVLMSVGPVTSREQHKLDGEVFDMDL